MNGNIADYLTLGLAALGAISACATALAHFFQLLATYVPTALRLAQFFSAVGVDTGKISSLFAARGAPTMVKGGKE